MMTPSNGNIFRVTGPLCREFTGPWWIPLTKASDAELWCLFLICAWINGWVNNREAVDWRRHHAHYDVNVMYSVICRLTFVIHEEDGLSLLSEVVLYALRAQGVRSQIRHIHTIRLTNEVMFQLMGRVPNNRYNAGHNTANYAFIVGPK